MLDRTTKILLALMVLGIWGLLLRPVFTPIPARAQQTNQLQLTAPVLSISPLSGAIYFAPADGNVYLFEPNTLHLQARAVYVPASIIPKTNQQKPATFTNPALP